MREQVRLDNGVIFETTSSGYRLVSTGQLTWLAPLLGDSFDINWLIRQGLVHDDMRPCSCGGPHAWQHCQAWNDDPCYCG